MSSPHLTLLSPSTTGLETGDENLSIVGTGNSIPWGIDAVLQYDNLTFNITNVVDKIRVTGIEGLDDADIRDAREDNPADDGETPYDSNYGGRTLVLSGRIEAFQRDKLRDMQEAIRTAFSDIKNEKSLYFLTNDRDTDHYINCKKNAPIKWTEEQKGPTFFRDFQITLRASDPRFYKVRKNFVSILSSPDYDNSTNLVSNYKFTTNTTGWTNVGLSSFTRQTGLSPTPNGTTTAGRATSSGAGQYASVDFSVISGHQYSWLVEVARVSGTPSSQISIYNAGGVEKDTVLFSPGPHWTGISDTFTADATATWKLRVYGVTSGLYFTDVRIIDLTAPSYKIASSTSLPNLGNYSTLPTYKIIGPASNVEFDILSEKGTEIFKLKDSVTIANGDYRVVDLKKRTIVDSMGVNKFSDVDLTSDFPRLYPGNNYLEVDISNFTGKNANSEIVVEYKDAYI